MSRVERGKKRQGAMGTGGGPHIKVAEFSGYIGQLAAEIYRSAVGFPSVNDSDECNRGYCV